MDTQLLGVGGAIILGGWGINHIGGGGGRIRTMIQMWYTRHVKII